MEGKRFLELGKEEDFHPELESLDGDLDPGLPSTEDVILKTEQVTKNIQELLRAAQEFKHDRYGVGCRLYGLWVLQRAREGPVFPSLRGPLIYTFPSLRSFVPCSEKIHLAVTEMASLFPKVQEPARGAGLGGAQGVVGVENLTAAWVETQIHWATIMVHGLKSEARLHPPSSLLPEASLGASAQLSAAAQRQRLPAAE